jgi:hypothetical protein
MNSWLENLGLWFIRLSGNVQLEADADAFISAQKMLSTPEGIDFLKKLGVAASLMGETAIPPPIQLSDELTGSELNGPNAANKR